MEVLLRNIKELLKKRDINMSQALYLIYLYNEEEFSISTEYLLKLSKNKYIKGGKVSYDLLKFETVIGKDTVTGTIEPIYNEDLSNEVVRRLCSMFCVHNGKGAIVFPGDIYDTVEKTAAMFLKDEQKLAYYFMIFLYMFPIEGSNNRKWEKFFTGKRYTGPTLRIRSKRLGKDFIAVAKKKDMGAILYAVFIYMQSAYSDGKGFAKKPINFLGDEFEEWYSRALMDIRKARNIRELFKKNNSSNSMYTMV